MSSLTEAEKVVVVLFASCLTDLAVSCVCHLKCLLLRCFCAVVRSLAKRNLEILVWMRNVFPQRGPDQRRGRRRGGKDEKRIASCVGKISCHLICLSLASPPLSWHPVALCSDLWSRDRSLILRAASPLQTLR